jgi:phosphatidylethanolamine/phosphatidyl-N-methylethanolamine N-methyltransferase
VRTKDAKSGFKKIYDRLADNYDMAYGRVLGRGHKIAIRAMKLKGSLKILEVGIGTGLTLPLYPRTADILGIDISEAMLDQAREKIAALKLTNTKVHTMSAEKLEFKDGSFDRVFAPSVISVVPRPEKVLEEMIRVCKPGGYICVVSHFAGKKWYDKFVDRICDVITQRYLGFRMTTKPTIVENNSQVEIVSTEYVFPIWKNFARVYLLKKI